MFLRLESLVQKLKRQTTETERFVRMDLRLEMRNLNEKDSRGTIVKKIAQKNYENSSFQFGSDSKVFPDQKNPSKDRKKNQNDKNSRRKRKSSS
ncbi:hypothetical protein LEP1GSC133_0090 [Leptospira borgpetersenii serovar Pomona str. 200901868]|uniref:Uncharacterized protein n=1 Tax=Leptospira borgpetersenii serovar Pomona str. 200901868 TaxID=1192866 RepID=M6WEJ4_LEPBO|nr:hypothetical protein LEP1GSC133_0090 [Leptospira borgpetersenii serovar Pomona str. 200901868]